MRACVAIAALFKWAKIMLELRALDVVTSAARENRAISAATRRCDAIERVSTILDACENIVDCGDAEHVTWSAFWHRIANPSASVADNALFNRTADTDAVEVQRSDLFGRMPAQILIIRTLHYAIQCLIRLADALFGKPLMLGNATLRPTIGAFHGTLLVAARVHQCSQLVEREHDVGADLMLDPH